MKAVFFLFILFISACATVQHGSPEQDKAASEAGQKMEVKEVENEDDDKKAEAKIVQPSATANPAAPLAQGQPSAAGQPEFTKKWVADVRKKILLVRFVNRSPYGGADLVTHVMETVKEKIGKHPEFLVVPGEELEGSENFILEGEFFFKTIFEKARNQGIHGVVIGSIEDVNFKDRGDELGLFRSRFHTASTTMKFQLFDAISEKEVLYKLVSEEVTEEFTEFLGNKSEEAQQAARAKQAASRTLDKILQNIAYYAKRVGWVGQIAKVDPPRYYINAGEVSGIVQGQLLNVYGEAQFLQDPTSGEKIGTVNGPLKGILKVIEFAGRDAAIAVALTGNNIRESDRVELYTPTRRHEAK